MPESSDQLDSRSRKNLASILTGLGRIGQVSVAKALDKDESTISKMKDREIPQFAKLLAVLGLKCVNESRECYTPEYISSLRFFANIGMSVGEQPQQLEQDF